MQCIPHKGTRQSHGSITGNQMRLCRLGPVLDIVIQSYPMPWLSSLGVRQDLHASGAAAKRCKSPRIRTMHPFVKSAPNEPCSQRIGKQCEGLVVARPNAPGAAEHQGHRRKGRKHLFQVGKPLEKRIARRLIRAHVYALSGMPEHRLVVDDTIQIKVEHDVSAARR